MMVIAVRLCHCMMRIGSVVFELISMVVAKCCIEILLVTGAGSRSVKSHLDVNNQGEHTHHQEGAGLGPPLSRCATAFEEIGGSRDQSYPAREVPILRAKDEGRSSGLV